MHTDRLIARPDHVILEDEQRPPDHSSRHRHLLMHCHVINQMDQASERFIDHQVFELWKFLVTQRHGLDVLNPIPCVWVPRDEAATTKKLFDSAPFHRQVRRVRVESFDKRTGVTNHRQRFVSFDDLNKLKPRLLNHWHLQELTVDANGNASIDDANQISVDAGEAISNRHISTPAKLS